MSSFAAIPQQLWSVKRNFCAKHGIKDDLTLGLGLHRDGRRTTEAQDCGVLLLERAGLSQRRTLLVRFGGEEPVVSFGKVAVPTLGSTQATLTKH